MTQHCQSILVVEDEAEIRENLKILLELEGYSVVAAENGKVGLEALKTMPRPCLILLDLLMPVMNGEEFLAALREEDVLATVPVCLVSGAADKPATAKGLAFIKKPIDLDSLMKFVRQYCGKPGEEKIA